LTYAIILLFTAKESRQAAIKNVKKQNLQRQIAGILLIEWRSMRQQLVLHR